MTLFERLKRLRKKHPVELQTEDEGDEILRKLRFFARASAEDVVSELKTSVEGLSEQEVHQRTRDYGCNEVICETHTPWILQLLSDFKNPFSLLLLGLAVVSYFAGELRATVVMVIMVLLSVLIQFVQEFKSGKAAEKLKSMVRTTCHVLRIPHEKKTSMIQEIPLTALVPGDIILLSAGDLVPADIRIIQSKDLFISESVLTGEAIPVEKHASILSELTSNGNGNGHANGNGNSKGMSLMNICFMGTTVVSGSATALVLSTGAKTYFGVLAEHALEGSPLTSFDIGINQMTKLLLRFIAIMAPTVFLLNGLTKGDYETAFFFALSVAVGLTPEMLPMIVTSNLAKGAHRMAQKEVIAKRLNFIQNLGAMDILCTDKTGTLTLDKIVLERFCDVEGQEDDSVMRYAYLNSFFQTGLKGLLDRTILEHNLREVKNVTKVDEIPFDFQRKIMSVIVSLNGKHRMIAKGSPEEILKRCTCYKLHEKIHTIEKRNIDFLRSEYQRLSEQGFRVIAVAYKDTATTKKVFGKSDEEGLILRGYLAFLDPPKPTAKETIAALAELGIEVKILTGDNPMVTKKICGDVGLNVKGLLTGSDIEGMSEDKLREVVRDTTVFAHLSPLQKEKIINALHGNHHVVGYLGDGINDAPALRAADVGISVNNAVDIAKESADMILMHKSLLVLRDGVIEGRKTFANTMKYIKATASSNFGNVLSVVGSAVLLPFLPMMPIHLLVQNLLYNFAQISIPFDHVDEEFLEKPRKWSVRDLSRFMLFMGPLSSIFDYVTFGLLWFYFRANTPEHAALFQTGWFVEGLLTQTVVVHMLRTEKIPFFQSRASLPVILVTLGVIGLGISLPFTLVGEAIGLTPLPLSYFPFLLLIIISYCVLTQFMKRWFIKRFHHWL